MVATYMIDTRQRLMMGRRLRALNELLRRASVAEEGPLLIYYQRLFDAMRSAHECAKNAWRREQARQACYYDRKFSLTDYTTGRDGQDIEAQLEHDSSLEWQNDPSAAKTTLGAAAAPVHAVAGPRTTRRRGRAATRAAAASGPAAEATKRRRPAGDDGRRWVGVEEYDELLQSDRAAAAVDDYETLEVVTDGDTKSPAKAHDGRSTWAVTRCGSRRTTAGSKWREQPGYALSALNQGDQAKIEPVMPQEPKTCPTKLVDA
ncbi:hypothetical protein PHYSODRAFT_326852 [Phytophthora sojae]|uniref:Uncharacterized protein n=1 Tax=Phytophthora sojae (strain P6497) TaxID=1094619 RepID=G4Z1H8_PHYSP|nr:hypothetical protein PHYSODRAFT_326852 [Phytophthora sojae]EGZ25889.1 hypothetical protein PHYSODRAFT_326852 [Phytophthora sojae]|eukprot:XP_009521177.1 hypothetical protein PHYSODRAFT_326852 [Phytophthora sojae]